MTTSRNNPPKHNQQARTILKTIIQQIRDSQESLQNAPINKHHKSTLKNIQTNLQQLQDIATSSASLSTLYEKATTQLELLRDIIIRGKVRGRSSRYISKHPDPHEVTNAQNIASVGVTGEGNNNNIRELKQLLLHKQQIIIKLRGDLNHCQHKLVSTSQKYSDNQAFLKNRIEQLQKENKRLEKKLSRLEDSTAKIEEMVEQYKDKLKDAQDSFSAKRIQMVQEIAALKSEIARLTTENQHLVRQNRNYEKWKANYEEDTNAVLSNIENEINQLNDELIKERTQKQERNGLTQMLRIQMAQANIRLRESEQELESLKLANSAMKQRLSRYQKSEGMQEKDLEGEVEAEEGRRLERLEKMQKQENRKLKCLDNLREEIDRFKSRID